MGHGDLTGLWARLTGRTAEQNPALARRGALGVSFAAEPVSAGLGPPPAVYFADDLAGLSDAALIHGPQRRSPGHLARSRVPSVR